uniref:transposase n=1 Tax=Limosilactobacillus reuteri TaxID=1598 RepID=UPI0035A338BA
MHGHLNVLIGIHQSRSSCLICVTKFVQVISCNLPLLKLRPDSVSHYTIHRCQVLACYKEGIKRGFETKFSNGRTEGINNRIKTIKRVACGYRYFTAFKTRIYLIIGHQIQTN